MLILPLEGETFMDELLTFKQAAEFLKISERTLLRLLAEEDIPARKLGNKWRFSKQALLHFISTGQSKQYAKNAIINEDDLD